MDIMVKIDSESDRNYIDYTNFKAANFLAYFNDNQLEKKHVFRYFSCPTIWHKNPNGIQTGSQ